MVKNKKGGRNHRKQASKHAKPTVQAKIRLAKEEDETYALVVKLNGNSMCDVLCNDKEVRLLQIRKKFRGRNRRDNNIGLGTMLLVGLRSWEVRKPGKKGKVDLLYVYSREQVDTLKTNKWAYDLKHVFPSGFFGNSDYLISGVRFFLIGSGFFFFKCLSILFLCFP